MRRHADWMTQLDERILEFISERGNHPPSAIQSGLVEIGVDLDYNTKYINQRCSTLEDHGLLVNVGAGTYSITEQGEQFLAGEIDAGELADQEAD